MSLSEYHSVQLRLTSIEAAIHALEYEWQHMGQLACSARALKNLKAARDKIKAEQTAVERNMKARAYEASSHSHKVSWEEMFNRSVDMMSEEEFEVEFKAKIQG